MILKSEQMDYRDKNRKHIMYMLFTTIIFLGCAILGIQIIDINSINSLPILEDLNSINIVIGIIAIPTCILYYYMYRNNEFFILTLSYVSILIEYIYVNFINSYNVLTQHLMKVNMPIKFLKIREYLLF